MSEISSNKLKDLISRLQDKINNGEDTEILINDLNEIKTSINQIVDDKTRKTFTNSLNQSQLDIGRKALNDDVQLLNFITGGEQNNVLIDKLGNKTYKQFFSKPRSVSKYTQEELARMKQNLGEDKFNKHISNSNIAISQGEHSLSLLAQAQSIAANKKALAISATTILKDYNKDTQLSAFDFNNYKDSPLFPYASKYSNVGNDATKLLYILENEAGISFNNPDIAHINRTDLFTTAGNIVENNVSTNVKFNLGNSIWAGIKRIDAENTNVLKTFGAIRDIRSHLIQDFGAMEDFLWSKQIGTTQEKPWKHDADLFAQFKGVTFTRIGEKTSDFKRTAQKYNYSVVKYPEYRKNINKSMQLDLARKLVKNRLQYPAPLGYEAHRVSDLFNKDDIPSVFKGSKDNVNHVQNILKTVVLVKEKTDKYAVLKKAINQYMKEQRFDITYRGILNTRYYTNGGSVSSKTGKNTGNAGYRHEELFTTSEIDDNYKVAADNVVKYDTGSKLLGDTYGKSEGPSILKANYGVSAFNNIDDLQQQIEALYLQKEKATDTVVIAEIEDKINNIQKRFDTIAKEVQGKHKINVNKIIQISQRKKIMTDANNVIRQKIDKKGVTSVGNTNWAKDFKRAYSLGETIKVKGIGNVNVVGINDNTGEAILKKITAKPEEFQIPVSEILKDIVDPKQRKKLNNIAIKDLHTIQNNILKSNGVIVNVDNAITNIITTDSVDQMLGKWQGKYDLKNILGGGNIESTTRIREKVLGIVYKHAGWSLFGQDRDRAISTANEAYLNTLEKLKQINISTSMEKGNKDIAGSFLQSFSEAFNASFHQKYNSMEEAKGLFKGNHIIDKLIDEYNKYPEYQQFGLTNFIKTGTDFMATGMKGKHTYDLKLMSHDEINKYLHDKYDMANTEGHSNLAFETIKELEEKKQYSAVPTTTMYNNNSKSITDKAVRLELTNIAKGQSTDITTGELNQQKFKIAKNDLNNKIEAVKRISSKIIDDGLENNVGRLAQMEKDLINAMDIVGTGYFTKQDMKNIANDSKNYLGIENITYKDESELKKIVGSFNDVKAIKNGKEVTLKLNNANIIEYTSGKNKSVVGGTGDYTVNMDSQEYKFLDYTMKPTMKEQDKLLLTNELSLEKASVLSEYKGVKRYISNTPQASIEGLKTLLHTGEEFVALDYETTGLPGFIDNKLLIPTEIYGAKKSFIKKNGEYKLEGTEEFHTFVKPTKEVKQFIKTAGQKELNDSEQWILRNYAKYVPGLADNDKLTYNMYVGKEKIPSHLLPKLIEDAKEGMDFVNKQGQSLSKSMIGISKFTANKIIVGQNVADADEHFRRMGFDNAMAATKDIKLKERLGRLKVQQNKLVDLMGLYPIFKPDSTTRVLSEQVKSFGLEMGTSHLAKNDTIATLAVLEKEANVLLNPDSHMTKALANMVFDYDNNVLKENDVIAKTYGAADEKLTQGVYKFLGTETTEEGVRANLFKFGGEGNVSVNATSMSELQLTMAKDFSRIDEKDIDTRREFYINDRIESNIAKGINPNGNPYKAFINQTENALYATNEGRKEILGNISRTKRRYAYIEDKNKLYNLAKEGTKSNIELDRMKAEASAITKSMDDLYLDTNLKDKVREKQLNILQETWIKKQNLIKSFEKDAITIEKTIENILKASRFDKQSSHYKNLLANDYKQSIENVKSGINKPFEETLNDKNKATLLISNDDAIGYLDKKIERLSTEYADDVIIGDREAIYKGTAKWYNSKQGKAIGKALRQVDILSNIDTFGLDRKESKEVLTKINNAIKESSSNTKEHPWMKEIGLVVAGDDTKKLYADISSVTRTEHSIKGLMSQLQMNLDSIKSAMNLEDEKIINTSSLATHIYNNKDSYKNAVIKDMTNPIEGEALDTLKAKMNDIIKTSIEEKYKNLPNNSVIAKTVLDHMASIENSTKGLANNYINKVQGIKDIGAKNSIITENSLLSLNDLTKITDSYNPYNNKEASNLAKESWTNWSKKNSLGYGAQYKELQTKFYDEMKTSVFERLNTQANGYKDVAKNAWKQMVMTATQGTNSSVNDLQRDALDRLGWKTSLETADMSVKELGLQKLTDIHSGYAGQTLAEIPMNVLKRYKEEMGTDGIKNTKWPERRELESRVTKYLSALEETKTAHNGSNTPHYAEMPKFVAEEIDNTLNKFQEKITPTLTNVDTKAMEAITREVAPIITQETVQQADNIAKNASKFSRKAIIGTGAALGLAGFLAGGMRLPNIPSQSNNGNTVHATSFNDNNAKRTAGQNSKMANAYQTDGVNIRVSGRSMNNVNSNEMANNISKAINDSVNANINVTTRDDTTPINKSWFEDKIISLLKK